MPVIYKGDEIFNLVKSYFDVTNIGIDLYSDKLDITYSYKQVEALDTHIRRKEPMCEQCENCTRNIFELTPKKHEIYKHTCHENLTRFCIPLLYLEKQMGYIISEPFYQIGVGKKPVLCPLTKKIKVYEKDYVKSSSVIFKSCASYIYMFAQEYLHYYYDPFSRIQKFVSEGAQKKLTIADICAEVFMSRATVCNIIKKNTGLTALEYINESKMAWAKLILLDEKTSIAKVSEICGFRDPRYFTKKFKKMEGILPSEYRKLFKTTNLHGDE